MKMRILSLACVATAAALLTACTAATRNSAACEQLMRSKLADTSSDTLRVTHRGAAIHGSRVVVEGTIEHLVAASEVAASASRGASGPGAASVPTAVFAPAMASAAPMASASVAASAPPAASGLKVAAKSAAPKKISTPAAAECTFHGEALDVFRWLAPAKLATPVARAASAAD